MIYNEDLTKDLSDIFGEEVKDWSKAVIRNEIEKLVARTKKHVLESVNPEMAVGTLKVYKEIKNIDDRFMTHYTEELENTY